MEGLLGKCHVRLGISGFRDIYSFLGVYSYSILFLLCVSVCARVCVNK